MTYFQKLQLRLIHIILKSVHNFKIGVALLKNYENSETSPQVIIELLNESNQLAKQHLPLVNSSDNAVIQQYRQA